MRKFPWDMLQLLSLAALASTLATPTMHPLGAKLGPVNYTPPSPTSTTMPETPPPPLMDLGNFTSSQDNSAYSDIQKNKSVGNDKTTIGTTSGECQGRRDPCRIGNLSTGPPPTGDNIVITNISGPGEIRHGASPAGPASAEKIKRPNTSLSQPDAAKVVAPRHGSIMDLIGVRQPPQSFDGNWQAIYARKSPGSGGDKKMNEGRGDEVNRNNLIALPLGDEPAQKLDRSESELSRKSPGFNIVNRSEEKFNRDSRRMLSEERELTKKDATQSSKDVLVHNGSRIIQEDFLHFAGLRQKMNRRTLFPIQNQSITGWSASSQGSNDESLQRPLRYANGPGQQIGESIEANLELDGQISFTTASYGRMSPLRSEEIPENHMNTSPTPSPPSTTRTTREAVGKVVSAESSLRPMREKVSFSATVEHNKEKRKSWSVTGAGTSTTAAAFPSGFPWSGGSVTTTATPSTIQQAVPPTRSKSFGTMKYFNETARRRPVNPITDLKSHLNGTSSMNQAPIHNLSVSETTSRHPEGYLLDMYGISVSTRPSSIDEDDDISGTSGNSSGGDVTKIIQQQEIPWPVKKEAVVEGDLVLGGLMMVHEREDTITCGPVMPQGGIQALEAMLYTLDRLNFAPDPLLPNITLGAHILDDCDKDTYGLEMAVDFIKGRQKTGTFNGIENISDFESVSS